VRALGAEVRASQRIWRDQFSKSERRIDLSAAFVISWFRDLNGRWNVADGKLSWLRLETEREVVCWVCFDDAPLIYFCVNNLDGISNQLRRFNDCVYNLTIIYTQCSLICKYDGDIISKAMSFGFRIFLYVKLCMLCNVTLRRSYNALNGIWTFNCGLSV
jgi:hypothetical protein